MFRKDHYCEFKTHYSLVFCEICGEPLHSKGDVA